jgi:MOSC domain-containing protein YiiM
VLKEVINSGHVGWFYKVLEEGTVNIDDELELIEKPHPDLSISKLFDQGYKAPKFSDTEFLRACYQTGLMDKGWKPKLEPFSGL